MNSQKFIQSLTASQRRQLSERSDLPGTKNLVIHLGAIAVIGWLIAERVFLWPLLMVPQGILIVFLFTLMHECTHKTAFATQTINIVLARLCGFLLVLPPEWFRHFHFAHHRHTQDRQKDPELASEKPKTLSQYAIHISGIPVWVSQIKALVRGACGQCEDFIPAKRLASVQFEARLMLFAYCIIALLCFSTQFSTLLWVWLFPAILGQPFLRLYLLAEHSRCAFVNNVFENTRTTITNSVVRQLAWNMPYHTEHHAYPMVPFHRLPKLHMLLHSKLLETESGYMRFNAKYVNEELQK